MFSSTGERIKLARKNAGLEQKDLAALMDVSVGTVSRWERNKTSPSRSEFALLGQHLKIDPSWLTGEGAPDPGVNSAPQTLRELADARVVPPTAQGTGPSVTFGQLRDLARRELSDDGGAISPTRRILEDVMRDGLQGAAGKIHEMTDDEIAEFVEWLRQALAKKS